MPHLYSDTNKVNAQYEKNLRKFRNNSKTYGNKAHRQPNHKSAKGIKSLKGNRNSDRQYLWHILYRNYSIRNWDNFR